MFNAIKFYKDLDDTRVKKYSTWRKVAKESMVNKTTFSRLKQGRPVTLETFFALCVWAKLNPADYGGSKTLNEKQRRMEAIVQYMQEYVATYSNQNNYEGFSDTVFIDDMLYGIGMALDPEGHEGAQGFEDFRQFLQQHLITCNDGDKAIQIDEQKNTA